MSGWELGLALLGMALLGFSSGLVFVWWYARRVFRRKLGQLPEALLKASTTSTGVITPPTEP